MARAPIQGYKGLVLASKPLLYWRLDEASGTTAVDSSGNGNDGTIAGTVTYAQTGALPGDSNKAMGFAENGWVVGPALTFTNVTFEGWMKITATPIQNDRLIGFNGGVTKFGLQQTNNTNTVLLEVAGDTPIGFLTDYSTWHHYAVTYDGATVKMYVDGRLIGTVSSVFTPYNVPSIGISTTNSPSGLVDEFAVYPTVLSAATIMQHFKAGQSIARTAASTRSLASSRGIIADYAAIVFADRPIGYWRLGEASGTNLADSSGYAHDGTLVGGVTLNQTGAHSAESSKSALFNGSTGYINLGNTAALLPASALTLEAWVKAGTIASGSYHVITKFNESSHGTSAYRLFQNAAQIGFSLGGGTYTDCYAGTSPPVATGTWLHIVGTYDGTNMKTYVNGRLRAVSARSAGIFNDTTNAVEIGAQAAGNGSGSAGNPYNGNIQDVAIYDYALTAAQVNAHYQSGISALRTLA